MGVLDAVKNAVKDKVKSWLDILPAQRTAIVITEINTFEANVAKNRLWYRGDPSELDQFYKQAGTAGGDMVSLARFWASSPSKGMNVRKMHSGLPGLMVDTLADIVVTDLLDIEFSNEKAAGKSVSIWEDIEEENEFEDLITKAIQEVLVAGDGAFKISFDTELSEYPIIEFYSGEFVDYKLNRGRVQEVHFYSRYETDKKTYTLVEKYGKGFVNYELLDPSGNTVDMNKVPELEGLVNVTYPGNDFIMAVPMKLYPSPKWPGRGRSIFDLKTDAFDALDETISQWQDAIRLGRIKRYIPESLIPRDPKTGKALPINPFDNQFTAIADSMHENGESKIQTEQPVIQYEGYLGSYINNLDMALQGIISPSTLGIDVKKLDNADAQREKEKTTLYTRDKIINGLQKALPKLVNVALKSYATLIKQKPQDYKVTVNFGEYANPSFEAQVETLAVAAGANIMSIEAQVEELWGNTKDDDWKAAEVARIKAEKGIIEAEEPSYKPHGFAPEEAAILDKDVTDNAMDRLGDRSADRTGAGSVQEHEAQSEPPQARGNTGGLQVDTVAGDTTKKPKTV